MADCTCPEDWRAVPEKERMTVSLPGAETIEGNAVKRDRSKIFVFSKNCPVHGWKELTDD